jgi:Na+-driven multidrug efflux pump
MDILGCALAYNLSFLLKFCMLYITLLIVRKRDKVIRESFFLKINSETLHGFKKFVAFASTGLYMSCLEWWITEIFTIIAVLLSV